MPPDEKETRPGKPEAGRSGERSTSSATARPLQDASNPQPALMLSEAQHIAESIVGPVRWNGAEGLCHCPGEANHTTPTSPTDCKAVVEPIAGIATAKIPIIISVKNNIAFIKPKLRDRNF